MDADAPDLDVFADEVRNFLEAHASRRTDTRFTWGQGSDEVGYFGSPSPEVEAARVAEARTWQRTRYDNGFGWISGPTDYGGRGLGLLHEMVYDAVEAEYDVPNTEALSVIGLGMIGPTILRHGTSMLRERYLPAMYSGRTIACQLFSEPGAGSDLAGLSTRAERDGDAWIVNGQKVWTSFAQHADIGELLVRTDPSAPKHKGISAFVLDMSTPGVEVRPLRQMTGGADFNEVFLTDVRIPDDHRLGDVNGGWSVALTTLMNERATVGGGEASNPAIAAMDPQRLSALLGASGRSSDALRRDLSTIIVESSAAQAFNDRLTRRLRSGDTPGPEASIAKLALAQNLNRVARFASDVLGPRMTADTGEWGTFAWTQLLLSAPALRILGGTEEIMKTILAERVLGLPKEGAR
ncbi:acyl-CoA dehydrogenase (plasmid) [Rhodococcus jostii RHA1]|jgi:acyl-CoA dehydrogenase|uniref:Acyl-CoA dehydrogenase n=1 Tax=Rhodococcus jostii (strain RHA1) TaxID=101510 RepID=Q0RW40_RHOJR|nr:acyl-CoA dehydrogenase family protein [Rhodococcus jostii]ABH00496.1 acyl-CoA dehydrogenase [Rhodococcus jostii RHA1]